MNGATQLEGQKSGTEEVRDIACHQTGQALAALGVKQPTDAAIHSARKGIRKSRATLRLLRDALPERVYRRDSAALRDAARSLSAVRDAKVLIDALDRLLKLYVKAEGTRPSRRFRLLLVRENREARHRALSNRKGMAFSRRSLRTVLERAARWKVGEQGWPVIGRGLRRVYRKGRRSLREAQADPVAERLHEWRKAVKSLWHQMQVLEPLWPGPLGELADQLHKLADYLGDDHDLAVLRDKVTQNEAVFSETSESDELLSLIDRSRKALQDKAFVLGLRLYEEKPSRFASRMGRYWQEWERKRDRKPTA